MSDEKAVQRTASDLVFTNAVKAVQEARGSRSMFAKKEAEGRSFHSGISDELAGFIAEVTTCYLATASAEGQPSVQHRGGPPGFLKVLDGERIGFADFAGNQQYVSTGNIGENPRIALILMDYPTRRRVKIWGRAALSEAPGLMAQLTVEGYRARVLQAVVITVEAWDINCSQHIPQMFHAGDVGQTIQTMQARLKELDAENAALREKIEGLKSSVAR